MDNTLQISNPKATLARQRARSQRVRAAVLHLAGWKALAVLGLAATHTMISVPAVAGALPPVPVPIENPVTEPKRLLGKALFWDEQLSSDDTIACGTCHLPSAGGADPRAGVHPGTDAGTIDNVLGSPGIVRLDVEGRPVSDPVFGLARRVTPRLSPSNFGALWAGAIFWDGRAGPVFVDPESGEVAIASGGALEAQAAEALMSEVEMAKHGRTWPELAAKLTHSRPLALATDIPADLRAIVDAGVPYPSLFAQAFGDPAITARRIAFAIASYQRTLVADQTPWDRYEAGEASAMSEQQIRGWRDFQSFQCVSCHAPPLFTNNDFFNVGLRLSRFDPGRMGVTGEQEDAGEMKVPSLRNAGLRPRFMHTGQFDNIGAAIGFYRTGAALEDRDRMPGGGIYSFNMGAFAEADILEFLKSALTDPRVRDELFPFDRPTLRSERALAAPVAGE